MSTYIRPVDYIYNKTSDEILTIILDIFTLLDDKTLFVKYISTVFNIDFYGLLLKKEYHKIAEIIYYIKMCNFDFSFFKKFIELHNIQYLTLHQMYEFLIYS